VGFASDFDVEAFRGGFGRLDFDSGVCPTATLNIDKQSNRRNGERMRLIMVVNR